MSSLVFSGVRKRFGEVLALGGVDLEIESGELFAVIGPSGCGKTTLLRIASGLESADEGRVLAGGEDLTGRPPEKRGMAMVFQSYALFAHLSVLANVAFGLRYAGVARRDREGVAMEHLERVGLAHTARRMPAELSGGQQQRVALARALAVSPRVLLLDEPLSNLDARLRESTRVEVRRLLREQGVTALYVTHDQEEAMAMADRLAVMRDGRLEQVGSPEEVYRRPRSAFVARFVARANLLPGLVGVVGAGADAQGRPEHEVRCGEITLRAGCADPQRSLAAGEAVTVAVRPECLLVTEDPGGLAARVADCSFLGQSFALEVEAGSAGRLHAVVSSLEAAVPPGTEVRLAVEPGSAMIVDGDPESA